MNDILKRIDELDKEINKIDETDSEIYCTTTLIKQDADDYSRLIYGVKHIISLLHHEFGERIFNELLLYLHVPDWRDKKLLAVTFEWPNGIVDIFYNDGIIIDIIFIRDHEIEGLVNETQLLKFLKYI